MHKNPCCEENRKWALLVRSINDIREIEVIAARAWPAAHIKQYGGWMLRATEGITRRANSVLPLQNPDSSNLREALQQVQQFYENFKLPIRFQLTSVSQPANLDSYLESLGLVIEMRVKVLIGVLSETSLEEPEVGIVVFGSPWKDWYATYRKAAGFDNKTMAVRQGIIERITTDKACAAAIIDNQIVGVGMGVLDGEWLGLFSLVTDEKYRRRKVARSITQSLISWGIGRGATQSYLQVEEDNGPAQQLYYSLGFENAYNYWYRVKAQ